MRRTWLLALLLLVPTGSAYHLSVGAEDTLLLQPGEPPASVGPETFARASATDCPDPGLDPSLAMEDGLCGLLAYNQGTQFSTQSPADQLSRSDVTIDLVMTSYVGLYGTSTCQPWCSAPSVYRGIHDAGRELGLTDDGEQVWERDGGSQTYGGHLYYPGTTQAFATVGQDWLLPVTDTSFVGFVYQGAEPLDPQGLTTLVERLKGSGALPAEALAEVCAFSPQAELGTHAADGTSCEISLRWTGGQGGPNDPCDSEAYLCGAFSPAWRSTSVCPMWHAACYLSDGWNSAHHWTAWHGVVAPTIQDCSAAEPGFVTDASTFIAHDLDLYGPPSDVALQGLPYYWDALAENVPGLGPLREGRAPDVTGAPLLEPVVQALPFTPSGPEPNTDGWDGTPESSQTIQQDRSPSDCQRLATDEEALDPWVNLIDAQPLRDVAGLGSPVADGDRPDRSPGPIVHVTGHVGLFADADDDGAYEQAPPQDVLDGIHAFGAYPILWDHHAPGEGCVFRNGATMGDLTTGAGYRSPTGLVSVLRMTAGTLYRSDGRDVFPILEPTAVVMLSSGLDPQDPEVADVIDGAAGGRPVLVLPEAFRPQCEEPTGGFTATWEAALEPGPGDGLVTAAIVTLAEQGPGGGTVPQSPVPLNAGTHVWWDTDPFDAGLVE